MIILCLNPKETQKLTEIFKAFCAIEIDARMELVDISLCGPHCPREEDDWRSDDTCKVSPVSPVP